jgi:phytoene dehydrogenase-like protein
MSLSVGDGPDAVVVGAGPNGLAAAATLARAGWEVLVVEAAETIGGGARSAGLTRPGFVHDPCASVHPLAVASPAFQDLELGARGLRWLFPEVQLAHPLDGGRAALLMRSVADTAATLGVDRRAYQRVMDPLVAGAAAVVGAALSPRSTPPVRDLAALTRLGALGIWPAATLARRVYHGEEAQALLAGLSAHSMLSLRSPGTAGHGLFLGLLGHWVGWPVAAGGSQTIADALASVVVGHGGRITTGWRVERLHQLPEAPVTLLDVSPVQLLSIAGEQLPDRYRRALGRYRYGCGVWKVDWALSAPIPWVAEGVRRAATVHVGGTLTEVAAAEAEVAAGGHPDRPFVLVVQPTVVDPGRAPAGGHVAWAYCHVPRGSTVDMTPAIEAQIERFAPGFRDVVTDRHTMSPAELELHDANFVGGDIAIGRTDLTQLVRRPVVSRHPWRTPAPGVYLCSSATPPGPGVHGMCGWHAAETARSDRR